MNKARRKELDRIHSAILELYEALEEVKAEEEEAMDNMPESLQESERYEIMEEAVSNMEYAVDSLQEAMEYIASAME